VQLTGNTKQLVSTNEDNKVVQHLTASAPDCAAHNGTAFGTAALPCALLYCLNALLPLLLLIIFAAHMQP
jgi:hypothetical protein